MSDIEKIGTKNTIPLVDELVYYFKRICKDIVMKNPNKSKEKETLESIKAGDLYIKCIDGTTNINSFIYTREELLSYGVNKSIIDICLKNPNKIDKAIADKIIITKTDLYKSEYKDLNNYYRELSGIPNIGIEGIKIDESYIDLKSYPIDISKYIHEMSKSEQDIILSLGISDRLMNEHENCGYLQHIGSNKISIYKARKADNFQLLFIPPDIPIEISKRFEERYEECRRYTLRRIYSEAFKQGSDYYDNFIAVFIIIQAMVDVFSNVTDFFISGDIFDLKTIELIFKSNGIEYFPEIPKKYQLAMVRNINRLKKYKSTYQSIVDISSLFGFKNIEVFKYYILKERRKNNDGSFIFSEDEHDNYDLKFLKVPIDDNYDNYIHDKKNIIEYDELTAQDKYWDGDEDHNYIKNKIIDYEFNTMRTKYLSIDSIYSLSELSFQMSYFYTMIYDDKSIEDKLTLKIPTINPVATFRFIDIISYLFALGYIFLGVEDKILYKTSEVLTLQGFNFDVNMQKLSDYVIQKGFTMEELGVSNFQVPDNSILTYNQLMYIFTQNKNVYDHITKQLRNAANKDVYDIYKYLYEALMVTKVNGKFFKKSNGELSNSYTDYLMEKDSILYKSLETIKEIEDISERQSKISNTISDVVYILEDYLENNKYDYLWYQFPSVSSESVKMYMYKVINLFKSYKIDILNINTLYKFDDKLDNTIMVIDKIRIKYGLHKRDVIDILENLKFNIKTKYKDTISIEDRITITRMINSHKYYDDFINIFDKIASIYITLKKRDSIDVMSRLLIYGKLNKKENIQIKEVLSINGNTVYSDFLNI